MVTVYQAIRVPGIERTLNWNFSVKPYDDNEDFFPMLYGSRMRSLVGDFNEIITLPSV